MPRMAGPWLAGCFDNDRAAAKAAADALNMVFPTAEKVQGVRKAFQHPIVEFCRDAILHETIQTLSDERVVSSEDAEATYYRVVATSLSVIGTMIENLPLEDQEKESTTYEEIFGDAKLWDTVVSPDIAVRRATHRLVRECLGKRSGILQANIKPMSNAYIYKGLHSNQTGSALDFVKTVLAASTSFPTIWTDDYSGKRSAISRLRQFLKQGSQSSPAEFWDFLHYLFQNLPTHVLPTTVEDIVELLTSARVGISKREERSNAASAWPTYLGLVELVIPILPDADAEKVLEAEVAPILEQYLFPDAEKAEWTIASPRAASIVSRIARIDKATPVLVREWPRLGERLLALAKMSQPEQSKDYDKSQRNVAAAGERLANVLKYIWAPEPVCSAELTQTLDTQSVEILEACISLLKTRNGKPYGAAAVLEHLLRNCSEHLLSREVFRSSYAQFIETDMSALILSPSAKYLMQGLLSTQPEPDLTSWFASILRNTIAAEVPDAKKVKALRAMFTPNTPDSAAVIAKGDIKFQQFVIQAITTDSVDHSSALFAELLRLDAVTSETTETILSKLTASLSVATESRAGLSAIDHISSNNQSAIRNFMTAPNGTGDQLLPVLLQLEQSPDDEIAEQAATISSRLSLTMNETTSNSRFAIILQNLERVSRMSMTMDALYNLTFRMIGPEKKIQDPSEILPSSELWLSTLRATLEPPVPSLALMSILGGAVHSIQPLYGESITRMLYDAEGFSQALRIAMYVTRLLSETKIMDNLGTMKATVLTLLQLSVLIAEDSVSVPGSNRLLKGDTAFEGEVALLDFISEANGLLAVYWKEVQPTFSTDDSTESSQFFAALEHIRAGESELSPLSYYAAACFAKVYANLFEIHGFSADQSQKCEDIVKGQHSGHQFLDLTSTIAAFQQPLSGTPTLTRSFNELVAKLTDSNIEEDESNVLRMLSLLNTILGTQEDILHGIPKQRLIFLVKRLLPSLGSQVGFTVKSEVFKTLAAMLPGLDDMYGQHWEQSLDSVIETWKLITAESENGLINEGHVLLENSSLRLLATLRKLARSEEANDDLVDALKERVSKIQEGLVGLLEAANGISDENHQPLRITDELLARQVTATNVNGLDNLDDLYPMVYTPSRSIQQAAFDLLHKGIPVVAEKISFDAAIDKKTAQLPDELLSLILEAPTLDSLAEASFQGSMPLPLQGYLYSWRLVFDHFQNSSYKVKSDYIEKLKDGTYLSGLLSLTFDFLGHTNGRAVDVSKFNVQEYVPDEEISPEKDVQWLLTHLYYLALTHLPGLVRSYYLEIRSRQLPQLIENWTAKHISPLIIEASLKDVVAWAEKPKEDPEYENVTIKVGFRSREITASYEVDEQTMSMKIVLPEAYSLASAQVLGVNRVGVNEEKWQSWLRNCQGVIAFSVSTTLPPAICARILTCNAERQPHRRPYGLAQERDRRDEGPHRVCDLLLHHQRGQEDPEQEVSDVQAHVPLELFGEVVQDE